MLDCVWGDKIMSAKIMIVSDDFSDIDRYFEFLSEKYNVVMATGAGQMVSFLNNNIISAIILDVSISQINNYGMLRVIRNNPQWNGIPVIVITSEDNENSKVTAMSLGANEIILHPCNHILLEHMLTNEIRLCKSASNPAKINTDKLTGIMNYDFFFGMVSKMVSTHTPKYYIISFINVNNFKIINDQYGTDKGDNVLCHIAQCLEKCTQMIGGICCRVSADYYAALYPAEYAYSNVVKTCHQLITKPRCIRSMIHIRIGRYTVDDTSLSVNSMLDRAAMAAESIKGRYDIYIAQFNKSMRSDLLHEQQIINDMHQALSKGQFEPWFQPQYDHSTGSLIGAEALVRWKKDNTYISPAEFVPVFERNGFIYEMDKYIWEQTSRTLRRWIDEGRCPMPVSVNISRCDILHDDCIDVIKNLISKYDLPIDLLRLEITESAFSESTDRIVSRTVELIQAGFTVEIDDFGSGFSSLNTLKDVPASILKLDMRFFERTGDSQRSGNIIESVVRMAKWLGMVVIAEGVEQIEEADYLKSIGCSYIQGYLYQKPMPVCEYEKELDKCNKEQDLVRQISLKTFNTCNFWDPRSIETFIFNNYVGATCIFEYKDHNVEMLRVNDQFLKELGSFAPRKSPVLCMNLYKYLSDENKKKLIDNIWSSITEHRISTCEIIVSDGKRTEFMRITTREIARAGERHLIYGTVFNITQQRNIEDKLRVVLNNTGNGIMAVSVKNDKRDFIFSNHKFYKLIGCSEDEYRNGMPYDFLSLVYPDDRENVRSVFKNTDHPDKSGAEIKYRIVRHDGETVWLKSVITVTKLGNVPVQICAFSDITEEIKVNLRLQTLNESIKKLTNDRSVGFCRLKIIEGYYPEIMFVNEVLCKMIGMTKEEVIAKHGDNACGLIVPEDITKLSQQSMDSLRSNSPITARCRLQHKNGEYITVVVFGRFVKDKSGQIYLNAHFNNISLYDNQVFEKRAGDLIKL